MRPNRIRRGLEGAAAEPVVVVGAAVDVEAEEREGLEAERVPEDVAVPEVHLEAALEEREDRRVGALEEKGARRAGIQEVIRVVVLAAREEAEGTFP